MNCNIIKDLLPLYIDDCCSDETRELVKEHLEACEECNALYLEMSATPEVETAVSAPRTMKRVNDWRASIMQSLMFLISFALITVGVALEAGTDYNDFTNGYFAFNIVLPATGFMLSLANWHFVRLYKNRRIFSNVSQFLTFAITLAAHIWCMYHYEMNLTDILDIRIIVFAFNIEILITIVSCIASKTLSDKYAELLGKE